MVQGVRDNGILVGEDGLKDTCVGIKAGSIKDGVFGAVELCDLVFEILVDVLLRRDSNNKEIQVQEKKDNESHYQLVERQFNLLTRTPFRQRFFYLSTTDETNTAQSRAVSIKEVLRAGNDLGMVSESQIVVGTKVDLGRCLAILAGNPDGRVLGGDNDTLRLVGACGLDTLDFGLEDLVELCLSLGGGHSGGGGEWIEDETTSNVDVGGGGDTTEHS